MNETSAPNCGRENDLIGYLYGELSETESSSFQRHATGCQSCTAELASLQEVRQSVIAWRNESLAGVSPAFAPVAAHEPARPSAIAALKEFFNLSPLWLKGAVAFASILFCLFAGLAIARLRTPAPVLVAGSGNSTTSEQQINALVEKRVQEELERRKATSLPANTDVARTPAFKETGQRRGGSRMNVAFNDPVQKARRPLSKSEREQLAADLRLVAVRGESDIDLLEDGINQ